MKGGGRRESQARGVRRCQEIETLKYMEETMKEADRIKRKEEEKDELKRRDGEERGERRGDENREERMGDI